MDPYKELLEAQIEIEAARQPGPEDCPARHPYARKLCTEPRGHPSIVPGSKYVWHTLNGFQNWAERDEGMEGL